MRIGFKAFCVYDTALGSWLNMWKNYDLWHAQQSLDLFEVRTL